MSETGSPRRAEARGRGVSLPSVLVMVGLVLGIVGMHSVSLVAPSHPVTAGHAAVADADHSATDHGSTQHVDPAPSPSSHHTAHPCVGTVVSWPALHVPTGVVESSATVDGAADRAAAVTVRAGRGPPALTSCLDRSVRLRV